MQREKLRRLAANDRGFWEKTKPAALMALAMAFTFVVYAVLDLVVVNRQDFAFGVPDVLGPTLGIAFLAAAALYLVLMLLPGTLFDGGLSLCLGLLLAGYLQGTFLNLNLGMLTGDAVHWASYAGHAAWNLALWMGLLALPLALRLLTPRVWRGLLLFVPVVLIGMQGVALADALLRYDFTPKPSEQAVVTTDKMFELSSTDNILVFVIDRLDERFIREGLERDPSLLDNMDGFTYYPNHLSRYARTYPSVPHMLTGHTTHFEEPAEEYFTKCWTDEPMFTTLRAEGYTTKMYPQHKYTFGDAAKMDGLIDNVFFAGRSFDTRGLMGALMRLAAYRSAPHALKASLWMTPTAFDEFERYDFEGLEQYHSHEEYKIYQQLVEQGLTLQDDAYNFTFYHFNGIHGPFYLNEWTEQVADSSQYMHMRGELNLLFTFFDQMKELGVYETSTIIVTGDHGASAFMENINEAVVTALFVKPWGCAGDPVRISEAPVTLDNLRATIMQAAMLDYEPYGVPYDQVPEDLEVEREFLSQINEGVDGPEHMEEFKIRGDARDFSNWEKTKEYILPNGTMF